MKLISKLVVGCLYERDDKNDKILENVLLKSPTASIVITLTQRNNRLIKNEIAQFDWTKINIFSQGKKQIFVSGKHFTASNENVLSVMLVFCFLFLCLFLFFLKMKLFISLR